MKKLVWFSFLVSAVLFSSCATASLSKYHGIGRIKKYDIYSEQLPDSFDGFRIAFASDFHYESRFGKKRLPGLLKALQAADADLLLLGGDYRGRNGGNLSELFDVLYQVCVPYGTYGVMGNHENNANYEIVRQEMERTGIRLLEHQVDTLWKGNQYILLCGIRNPFDLTKNGISLLRKPHLCRGVLKFFQVLLIFLRYWLQ